MSVKIKAKLPKGDLDGLQHLTSQLRLDPEAPVVVAAVVFPRTISENVGDADDPWSVTVGIGHVEAVHGEDASFVRSLLTLAYESRTGKKPLPFGVDGETGEVAG